MGFKLWTRERLGIPDLQNIQDQTRNRFASVSAANSAIVSPQEGMFRVIAGDYGATPRVPEQSQTYTAGAWRTIAYGIQPAASLRNIGATPLTSNAWTLIPFTTEDVDTLRMHDPASNNSRIFAPVAGLYVASAQVSFTHSAATALSYRGCRIRKNGTTGQLQSATTLLPVAANGRVSVSTASVVVPMNAGDWLDVQAYHNASDAITTYSDADFATAFHVYALPGANVTL